MTDGRLPVGTGPKHADETVLAEGGCHTISALVVDNGVNRTATGRTGTRRQARKAGSLMDPYTAMKSIEYNQQELARLRGKRNWVTLFKK